MKYSAEDIVHQSFEKKFRGYAPDQVHEFLQGMAREWDYMSSELLRLQDEVETQTRELREFQKRERSLLDALSTAREVADKIAERAEERGERIVAEATLRGEQLVATAQRERELIGESVERMRRQRAMLGEDLREVLDAHARLLDEQVVPDEVASHTAGPSIHRRPRTQPPVPGQQIEQAEGPTMVVESADSETLLGVMSHEAAS